MFRLLLESRSPLMDAFDSAARSSGNPRRQHEKQEVEAAEGNPDTVSLLFSFSYETNFKTWCFCDLVQTLSHV